MKKETLLAATGRHSNRYEGAVNIPPVRTSTVLFPNFDAFEQSERREALPYVHYGRYGTETRHALQESIATLEGADLTLLYPSGLAACVFAILAYAKPGDHVLMVDTVYGSTRAACQQALKPLGIEVSYYMPSIGAELAGLMRENTKVVYVESPGSITFEMQDIPAIAKAAHARGAVVIGDNTWLTPLHANPFALGMDVSVQALTKYPCSASDVMMGAVSVREPHAAALETAYRMYGLNVSPDDCYLVQRGLRTLAPRLKVHEQNGLKLAEWFGNRAETLRVLHPALPSCPGHEFWKRYIGASCGLFSVLLKPYSKDAQRAMFDGMEHFGMGYSWGGFESLMIPLNASISRTAAPWKEEGLLIRIHAGLEHTDDLIADLEAGFARLNAQA